MNVRLPWRESEIELALPYGWRVIAEGWPKGVSPCTSVEDEFQRALVGPMGAAARAPRHATVAVFPQGGVTYPIFSSAN
jgi:hypothetical protein